MKKRMLAALLCLTMVLSLLPTGAVAQTSHSHCLCADGQNANCQHSAESWQAWDKTDSLPTDGWWYLTKPVKVAARTPLGAGSDLKLCLNGQSITLTGADRIYHLTDGAKLSITDCSAQPGSLTCTEGLLGAWGGAAIYAASSQFDLYQGKITGFTASGASTFGGAVNVSAGGTFHMYGGQISGNAAGNGTGSLAYGGGVLVNGTFRMYGGQIADNQVNSTGNAFGGGVFLDGGSFTMYGGSISGNTAKNGAGVYLKAGTFTMEGGFIQENVSTVGAGGGVRVNDGSMTMTGGTITKNTAASNGGGIYTAAGKPLTMTGGFITENEAASNGGGVTVQGTFTMSGGQISGNNVTSTTGPGGVFAGADMVLSGTAKILNNTQQAAVPVNLRVASTPVTFGPDGMSEGASIGITYVGADAARAFSAESETDYSGYFFSDKDTYKVGYSQDKKLVLQNVVSAFALQDTTVLETGKQTLTAVISPTDAVYGSVTWTSSDPQTVLVEQSAEDPLQATVTGLKPGTATVTVIADNGISGTCTVSVQELHDHCLCGSAQSEHCDHTLQQWQPWNSTTSLPTESGSWYLTQSVELEARAELSGDVDVKLCLNGQSITVIQDGVRVYHLTDGAKLTITDCSSEPGSLTIAEGVKGAWGGAGVYVSGQGTQLDLYGGSITGFTAEAASTFGAAVNMVENSTFNMYGGQITGNTAGTDESTLAYGGGVLVNGTFNMYGGQISGNRVSCTGNAFGGGVFLDAGSFTMYGGQICDNTAKTGAGVFLKSGSFTLAGGTIANNVSTQGAGGGVRVDDGSLTMTGGSITGNTAYSNGGGVYTGKDKAFTMTGGSITDNRAASNGGGVTVQGVFTMTGGSITGNQVTTAVGPGGVYAGDAIVLSGAAVIDGNTQLSTPCNLRVYKNLVTFGDGGMDLSAKVGITYAGTDTGLVFSSGCAEDHSACFFSDDASYSVRYDVNTQKLMLYVPMAQTTGHTDTAGYHDNAQWIQWDIAGTLPTESGHYYLAGDVKLEKPVSVEDQVKIVLCLNGQDIDASAAKRAYRLAKGAQLTICDCTAHTDAKGNYTAGKITGATNTAIFIANEAPAVTLRLYDGIITGCSIQGSGAAVVVQGGSTFHMLGGRITGNSATENGAGVFVGEGTFQLSGGKITGNTAGTYGGGVFVTSKAKLNMKGGAVSGNTSKGWGGGLYLAGSTTISGGSVSSNYAVKEGGGVYVTDCAVTMTGGSICYNTTVFNGGGLCVRGEKGVFTLSGGSVTGNKALSEAEGAGHGGGVIVQGKGTFYLYGGSVEVNEAKNGGGGIRTAGGSTFRMYGGTVTGNKAHQGGGIYLDDDALIEGGSITSNIAQFEGGGLYVNRCEVTMNGGQISENAIVDGNGGGICLRNKAQMVLNDGQVTGNKASYHGGGILVQSEAKLIMNGGSVNANTAGQTGGGIRSSLCAIEINGGTVSDNTVGISGAGIYGETGLVLKDCVLSGNRITGTQGTGSAVMLGDNTVLDMQNVKITGNETAGGTGAVHIPEGAVATIADCEFTGNTASTGGALYTQAGANTKLSGSTFTGNTAQEQAGAIYAGGILHLTDCTVTGNTDRQGNAAVCMAGTGLANSLAGDVIIADNQGGELLLTGGAKVEIPADGLGDKAKVLLHLPESGVTDIITGPYNYQRSGDIYTLTKGDQSLTTPDKDEEAPSPTTEPATQPTEQDKEDDGKKTDHLPILIGTVIVAAIALLVVVILVLLKRRKKEETSKT